jgi:CheY-like chemotaxis protein
MRTKLYTPFAQENSIAPGTGLGLSLVKSMVTMLNGEINIQSAQNVGTEVTVQFPMTLSSTVSSSGSASESTPTSGGSIERVKDDSLLIVQQKVHGRRAMLFPGTSRKVIDEATRMVRDAINRYLSGWFGFEATQSLSRTSFPDVIISDEADLPDLLKILPDALERTDGPMIVILCTAASRRSDKKSLSKSSKLEVVSHPFGPYKLARSIRLCLERLDRNAVIEVEAETQAVAAADDSKGFGIEEVITAVEQITIENPDPDVPDINVIQHGKILAHEDSVHAQLVVENGQGTESSQSGQQDKSEFPFPVEDDGTISPSNLDVPESERPALTSRRTISATRPELTAHQPEPATLMSQKGVIANSPTKNLQSSTPAPRLLLVDDNKVNLRLLQTFMKKRKYMDVFSAEDGQQAISVYRDLISASPPRPPDIIFMDISMPIMNGFEATRKIRKLESEFRDQFASPMETPNSALIIALTGLASGRDQSEAFTSGFDLYLVKPISFREVGRLLDNWEKNGGAATVGIPHGAVTGDTAGSASGG